MKRDPHPFLFAGVLLTGLAMPRDLSHYCFNPGLAMAAAIVYEGAARFRAYLAYPTEDHRAPSGRAGARPVSGILQTSHALPSFL